MIPQLFEMLKSAVTRIIDIQCRVARIETRLMVLAEKLNIDVKEKKHVIDASAKTEGVSAVQKDAGAHRGS